MGKAMQPVFEEPYEGHHPVVPYGEVHIYHSHARRSELLPVMGEFGVCGSPQDLEQIPDADWRPYAEQIFDEVAESRGARELVSNFNPIKEDWDPKDAIEEARHFATDSDLLFVEDWLNGHGSRAESGLLPIAAIRGQEVHRYASIPEGADEATRRAYMLSEMLSDATLQDFMLTMHRYDSFEEAVRRAAESTVGQALERRGRTTRDVYYTIKPNEEYIPEIALIGSGGDAYDETWYPAVVERLVDLGVDRGRIWESWTDHFDEDVARGELPYKLNAAVILSVMTGGQKSLGFGAELPWLVSRAYLNGQKLGFMMEEHESDKKSDPNRQRRLIMAHVGRAYQDLPGLTDDVLTAGNLDELAIFGASELKKFDRRREATTRQLAPPQ